MSTATLTAVTLAAAPVRTTPARPAQLPPSPVDFGRRSRARLVLTRRGRCAFRSLMWLAATAVTAAGLVLLWLAVAAAVAPGAVAGDGSEGVSSGVVVGAPVESGVTAEVVVGPGDTLWQIAQTYSPDRDPRSVVEDIVSINGLTGTGVQVGERLVVPID